MNPLSFAPPTSLKRPPDDQSLQPGSKRLRPTEPSDQRCDTCSSNVKRVTTQRGRSRFSCPCCGDCYRCGICLKVRPDIHAILNLRGGNYKTRPHCKGCKRKQSQMPNHKESPSSTDHLFSPGDTFQEPIPWDPLIVTSQQIYDDEVILLLGCDTEPFPLPPSPVDLDFWNTSLFPSTPHPTPFGSAEDESFRQMLFLSQ